MAHDNWNRKHSWAWDLLFIFSEIILIIIYQFYTEYGVGVHPASGASYGEETSTETIFKDNVQTYYPFFQDVHVMIFVGFGFLMVFLKAHSWTSVGYNFLVSCYALQLTIILAGFWHQAIVDRKFHKITLDIPSLIIGDFGAGAVMITFGALLGKCSLHQLWLVCTFEIVFYTLNEAIGAGLFQAVDMGGSMYVHTFGAYFGVAAAFFYYPKKAFEHSGMCASSYNSNLVAMVGTLFLWMFWPSFNGALASGYQQQRVIVNTVMAISGSCIAACGYSVLKIGRLDMEVVLNATLAGGVAVGSASDLVVTASISILIGAFAGLVSAVGFMHLGPYLQKSIGLHDTCGVHNLHGIPGVIGGLIGAISAASANVAFDGDSSAIAATFPAIAEGRTTGSQGSYQILALVVTLGISIVGGAFTGFVTSRVFKLEPEEFFNDKAHFAEVEFPTEDMAIEMKDLGFATNRDSKV